MARVIEENLSPRDKRACKYSWDEWLDGRHWVLTPGVDFSIRPDSMRVAAQQRARGMGLLCRTRVDSDGCVHLQAEKRD